MAINFAALRVLPGEKLEFGVAFERARQIPRLVVDLSAQNGFGQTRTDGLGDCERGGMVGKLADVTVGKSDLNHGIKKNARVECVRATRLKLDALKI